MSAANRRHTSNALRPTAIRCATGLLVLCALSACKKDPESAPDAAATATPAAAQAVPPQQAVSAEVQAMSAEQLREAAGKALNEQRLYAPAGDNAMEYYLALRDKQPNDPAVSSALTDLQPYALIATEQSIGRDDFVEAQRLYALMEKADPKAPALPRLKTSIAEAQQALAQRAVDQVAQTEEEAKRQAELEKQRLAQQQAAQQQAAEQLAAQQRAAAAAPPPAATPAQAGCHAAAAPGRRAAHATTCFRAAACGAATVSCVQHSWPDQPGVARYPAAAARADKAARYRSNSPSGPTGRSRRRAWWMPTRRGCSTAMRSPR